MKRKLVLLSISLIVLFGFTVVHKYYVSVTQIEYKKSDASLQIVSRIFVDDLEQLLKERYHDSIRLVSDEKSPQIDAYIADYFQKKLEIKINSNPIIFNFIGKEYEEDMIVCYLEAISIENPSVFEVQNQILMELFEEQQNIVHIKKEKIRKSIVLEKEKDSEVLKFSE